MVSRGKAGRQAPGTEISRAAGPCITLDLGTMPAKKKRKKAFGAVQAVKEMARERIGSPKAVQVIPDIKKKRKQEKHKPTLKTLLEQDRY